LAGWELYHKKERVHANPIMIDIIHESIFETSKSMTSDIAEAPAASPSRPSVMFNALYNPRAKKAKNMKAKPEGIAGKY
jgi:hypothetical protein